MRDWLYYTVVCVGQCHGSSGRIHINDEYTAPKHTRPRTQRESERDCTTSDGGRDMQLKCALNGRACAWNGSSSKPTSRVLVGRWADRVYDKVAL